MYEYKSENLAVSSLIKFEGHLFKLYEGKRLGDLKASIL
jgi:hypothetical protein